MGKKSKALEVIDPGRDLIKAIALDIGKEVAHHIKTMYPNAVDAASSTFLTSVRNCTYNQILAALEVKDAEKHVRRMAERKKRRRFSSTVYGFCRRNPGGPPK